MTTFEKVQAMLAEQLNIDSAKITPDSEIIADLKADSLDVFQLLMSIEDEYQTTVPDDKAQELKKVSDVVAFIDIECGFGVEPANLNKVVVDGLDSGTNHDLILSAGLDDVNDALRRLKLIGLGERFILEVEAETRNAVAHV